VPAFLGLADACLAKAPRLARTGGWVAVASMAGFVGVRMLQGVELQTVKDGIDRPVAAKLIEHSFTTAVGAPLLVLFLAGTAIGVIVLAVATWRAGFPRPAVVLLVLFPVVDSVAKGHAGTVASHVVLLTALGWFATALRPLALVGRSTSDRDMAVSAG